MYLKDINLILLNKCGDREHRFAYHKEDTVCDGRLTLFNSSRFPIRVYTFRNLEINEGSGTLNPQLGSDDPQNIGTCSLPMTFEHFTLDWRNV